MNSAGSTSNWGSSVFGGIGSQTTQPGGGNLLSMNYLNNCTPSVGGRRRKRKKSIKKCKSRRRCADKSKKTRYRRRRR
jgi:hypothetical protein